MLPGDRARPAWHSCGRHRDLCLYVLLPFPWKQMKQRKPAHDLPVRRNWALWALHPGTASPGHRAGWLQGGSTLLQARLLAHWQGFAPLCQDPPLPNFLHGHPDPVLLLLHGLGTRPWHHLPFTIFPSMSSIPSLASEGTTWGKQLGTAAPGDTESLKPSRTYSFTGPAASAG